DANSLVGSNPGDGNIAGPDPGDLVGYFGFTLLSNGDYVIVSPYWNGERGAGTWGDGSAGVRGIVSDANSLVGSNPGDRVGIGDSYLSIIRLSNGNYVVDSPYWSGERGAVTWGDGSAGVRGIVSDTNSLVGSNPGDRVGFLDHPSPAGVTPL